MGDTFIYTGDIDDLWLRDSAAQIHPLYPFLNQDPRLDRVISGLIQRSSKYIRHNPYANAFRIDDSYVFSEVQKKMGRHDLISKW
jgi:meiotically up-regulated gene 157 (Mug157) protein